ncbi:long-chain fatty acid--CoA ligase [Rhodopila sp.]|uniref:ANL family adenylate-forming protein n=1 Tax=Rhodopila sp. TaxID=2480087 RepID=UPI003D136B2F
MLPSRRSLASLTLAAPAAGRFIIDGQAAVALADLRDAAPFAAPLEAFRDKAVVLATDRQMTTALAAIALDGIARRLFFCTPDLTPRLPSILVETGADVVVSDRPLPPCDVPLITCSDDLLVPVTPTSRDVETEWVLFTSGTTGMPKMVVHTLAGLSGPLDDGVFVSQGTVWSTFYDIRRYGGMQIMLRALLGGGSLVLSHASEPVAAYLQRLSGQGVTHISGTPSHWRRALMSPAIVTFAPRYVRLSGETADQAILDRLRDAFPTANVAHAFASTEAGVGFDVRDGKAGFPADFIPYPNENRSIEMKVANGTLRIRSTRTARGYLGTHRLPAEDGFIDTGDLVEQRGDRYYFMGRREGVINVGGQKVFPEEVETVLTQHPDVLLARVWPRKNPIMGAVVAADLVLRPAAKADFATIRNALLARCRQTLAPHKVPVSWHLMDNIEMTASGKVKRA